MISSRILFAGLALIVFAIAQSTAPVAFTAVPAVVIAGTTYNITWGGGDGSPVTLTLRKGEPNNLATVGVLADSIDGDSFNWKVSGTLQSATDYALQITQGQSDINYSGLFTITGAASNSTSSATSSNSTITSSGTATLTGAAGNSTGLSGANATATSSLTGLTVSTTAATSAHSATSVASPIATTSPNSSAAVQYGSSAALVVGVFGAVLFLN